MYLISANIDGIQVFIAIVSLIVGWGVSYLGKLLDEKTNIAIMKARIDEHSRRIDDLEDELRELRHK
jgi:cell division protein FtsL